MTLGDRSLRVLRRAGTDERPILRLEGVADRGAAESLRGSALLVDRAEAPVLGEDEWYAEDLEGCLVADGDRSLGRVRRLLALPSCDVLEVERGDGLTCWCRSCATPCARSTWRHGGSTSTARSSGE